MVEPVDTGDLKSPSLSGVRVRAPLWASVFFLLVEELEAMVSDVYDIISDHLLGYDVWLDLVETRGPNGWALESKEKL